MSGTYPATPEPASVEIGSQQPTVVNMAESGKKQARIIGGHLWKLKLSYDKMLRSQFAPIYAFSLLQRGQFESFQYVPHSTKTPQGQAGGSPTVLTTTPLANTVLLFTGASASQSTWLKAGDVIKFASHSKVYMVTNDVSTSVGGTGSINFMPPLVESVPSGTAITVTDVPFTVSFDEDIMTWKSQAPNIATFTVSMIESIG